MRTKRVENVQQIRVVSLEPRPEIYVSYDGLVGLSERLILKDVLEEMEKGNVQLVGSQTKKEPSTPITKKEFISALAKRGSGKLFVYFDDYVSYGAGAGEEVAEFFFKSMPIIHKPATAETGGKEILVLVHTPKFSEEVDVST
jgi:hypothetical protein